jgi:Ni,Fe-hydrogenase III component G
MLIDHPQLALALAALSSHTAWCSTAQYPEPHRLDLRLPAADLVPAVSALIQAHWGVLTAITGLDVGSQGQSLELLYHFCASSSVVTLRILLPREAPVVPSLCQLIPSASVLEREIIEMFGVTVTDTPDSSRLYLPDDWPPEIYPMRKDAPLPTP